MLAAAYCLAHSHSRITLEPSKYIKKTNPKTYQKYLSRFWGCFGFAF